MQHFFGYKVKFRVATKSAEIAGKWQGKKVYFACQKILKNGAFVDWWGGIHIYIIGCTQTSLTQTHIPCIFFPDRSQFSNIWKSFEAMVLHSRVSHGYFSIIPWTLAFESWKRKISSKHRGIASPCSMCFFWWCSYVQLMLAKHNSLIPRQSITKIWLPLQQLWYKV